MKITDKRENKETTVPFFSHHEGEIFVYLYNKNNGIVCFRLKTGELMTTPVYLTIDEAIKDFAQCEKLIDVEIIIT